MDKRQDFWQGLYSLWKHNGTAHDALELDNVLRPQNPECRIPAIVKLAMCQYLKTQVKITFIKCVLSEPIKSNRAIPRQLQEVAPQHLLFSLCCYNYETGL